MKIKSKIQLYLLGVFQIFFLNSQAQDKNYSIQRWDESNSHISFLQVNKAAKVQVGENGVEWLQQVLGLNENYSWQLLSVEKDKIGQTHYRLQQTYKGFAIDGTMYIVHAKNGFIQSANGEYANNLKIADTPLKSESEALKNALEFIGAKNYKWQVTEEETHLKIEQRNELATYFPKGKLTIVKHPRTGEYHLSYQFDIYAHFPVSRDYVYVDVMNGSVIAKESRIAHINVPGQGSSKYSGTVAIVSDSTATGFRLRETTRGNGVETYNMQNGTDYASAVDFTHSHANWDVDSLAIDAHFGAEATYDYLLNRHGRNSIDDNGEALLSYIHFDNNFANAYWDGSRMTYGDGDATIDPLISPDICGHEIGHGLQQYTAGFNRGGESGALAESFSDMMGLMIEAISFPNRSNIEIYNTGDQPLNNVNGARNYIDPSLTNHPDTYLGNNWDFSGQNIHNNGVVQDHWFYILSEGLTGTNDNGDAYTVNGIGRDKVDSIVFRSLTIYLTPNSTFADARFFAIQAAKDLYGLCSPEEIETTNAWYAVGVGDEYDLVFKVDFEYNVDICATPVEVQFSNESKAASSFVWDFGDGTTSTDAEPKHSYPTDGVYTIKLMAGDCTGGQTDSLILVDEITIDNGTSCVNTNIPKTGTMAVDNCNGWIYDRGGESGDALDSTDGLVVITVPVNHIASLKFSEFDYPIVGSVTIYDGPSQSSPTIATYDRTNIPTIGQEIKASGRVLSIKEKLSSPFPPGFPIPLGSGFAAWYACNSNIGLTESTLKNLEVFPNPSTGLISITGEWANKDQIQVINSVGQLIITYDNLMKHNTEIKIDLRDKASGVYYIKWINSSSVETYKIILENK